MNRRQALTRLAVGATVPAIAGTTTAEPQPARSRSKADIEMEAEEARNRQLWKNPAVAVLTASLIDVESVADAVVNIAGDDPAGEETEQVAGVVQVWEQFFWAVTPSPTPPVIKAAERRYGTLQYKDVAQAREAFDHALDAVVRNAERLLDTHECEFLCELCQDAQQLAFVIPRIRRE